MLTSSYAKRDALKTPASSWIPSERLVRDMAFCTKVMKLSPFVSAVSATMTMIQIVCYYSEVSKQSKFNNSFIYVKTQFSILLVTGKRVAHLLSLTALVFSILYSTCSRAALDMAGVSFGYSSFPPLPSPQCEIEALSY